MLGIRWFVESVCIRGVAVLLIAALAACAAGPPRPSVSQDARPDILQPGVVFALVSDASMSAALRRAADDAGYTFRDEVALRGLVFLMLSFELPADVSGKEAIDTLEKAVPGATVGVNHAYRLQQSAVSGGTLDFANTAMGWTNGACRAAGPVGLIDTGVDPSAPLLTTARVVERRFADGASTTRQHGTDVASILADPSRLSGVTLYAADVMTDDGASLTAGAEALIRALDWLAGQGVGVVNMSLAGPYNKLLDLAIQSAAGRDMIIVAAVGNAGPRADMRFPAGFSSVIAVTAIDARQRPYRRAGRGSHVDLAAPGVDLLVNSARGARFVSGTSFAAPFVTARILSDQDIYTARSVDITRSRLAEDAVDLGATGSDAVFGAGLVQASSACGNLRG